MATGCLASNTQTDNYNFVQKIQILADMLIVVNSFSCYDAKQCALMKMQTLATLSVELQDVQISYTISTPNLVYIQPKTDKM